MIKQSCYVLYAAFASWQFGVLCFLLVFLKTFMTTVTVVMPAIASTCLPACPQRNGSSKGPPALWKALVEERLILLILGHRGNVSLEHKLHEESEFCLFIHHRIFNVYRRGGRSVYHWMNEHRNSCLITPAHERLLNSGHLGKLFAREN